MFEAKLWHNKTKLLIPHPFLLTKKLFAGKRFSGGMGDFLLPEGGGNDKNLGESFA